jgi:hypothetical protein
MVKMTQEHIIREFMTIPSVGKAVARDLYNLGYRSIASLKGEDPVLMYKQLCDYQGIAVDRCMLYTLYAVVYYASNTTHDPALLKWWNWKGRANQV